MSSRHSKAKSDHKEEEEIFVAAGEMRTQNEQNNSNPSSSLFDPVTSDFPQLPETSNQFGNQLSANEIEHPNRIIPDLSTSVLHPVTLEVPKLPQSRHSKAKSDHKKEEAIFVAAGKAKIQNEQNTANPASSLFDQEPSDNFAQSFQEPEYNAQQRKPRKSRATGPPSSAFVLFHREQEARLRIENPETTYTERRQKIGAIWKKEVDQDTKNAYVERCSQIKEDFMYEEQQRRLVGSSSQAATSGYFGQSAMSRNPPASKPTRIDFNPLPPKRAYDLYRREQDGESAEDKNLEDQPRHVPSSIRKRKSEDSPGPSNQKRSADMDSLDFSQSSLAKDPAEMQIEEPFEESKENSFEEEEEY